MSTRRKLLLVICAAMAMPGAAAEYPSRPIRLVVPAAPGGSIDVVGRMMAPKMSEALGQNVVVDNRTGANNIIGTEVAARSPADGYTLLSTSTSHTINPSVYRKLPYDTTRDFVPIIRLAATGGFVVVVHPAFPSKTLKELIENARSNPGKIVYGSAGIGNSTHLAGALFTMMAGIDLTHVPYKGAGLAVTDLLGGQIPLMFGPSAAVMPLVKSSRLRPLAYTAKKRSPELPDVPTVDEAGVKGYEATGWHGIQAPARTPRAIVMRVNQVINAALATPDIKARMAGLNIEPVGGTPEEFADFLKADIENYAKIVKAARIDPQ